MGGAQSNYIGETQNIENNIVQASYESCQASCTQQQSGSTINIVNSNVRVPIGFNQTCTPSANCVMSSQFDTSIQNLISSISDQSNTTATSFLNWQLNANFNTTSVEQNVTNGVAQLLESTCNANLNQTQSNDMIVIANSNVTGGSALFNQSGDPVATCVMNNLGKVSAFNNEQANNTETNKTEAASVAIFAFLIGAGALAAFGATMSSGKGNKNATATTTGTVSTMPTAMPAAMPTAMKS